MTAEGIVITREGRPIARLVPMETDFSRFIGSLRGQLIVDENDDLFSTGAWISDEWDSDWESLPLALR